MSIEQATKHVITHEENILAELLYNEMQATKRAESCKCFNCVKEAQSAKDAFDAEHERQQGFILLRSSQ